MLENMFVGKPPGNYDRLLDFSRAVTGTLFFVPTATFLEDVAPRQRPHRPPARPRPKARARLRLSRNRRRPLAHSVSGP